MPKDLKTVLKELGFPEPPMPLAPRESELKERLFIIKQLHELNIAAVESAARAEDVARESKLAAMKSFAETKVRIEILEQTLGIEQEECEHSDVDDCQCLDCGRDLTESMIADAYDRAKDRD